MSESNETHQDILKNQVQKIKEDSQKPENQQQKEGASIEVNVSQQFQLIQPSQSQQASSTFTQLQDSSKTQQKPQVTQQLKQQTFQVQKEPTDDQTQEVKPQTIEQTKPQTIQQEKPVTTQEPQKPAVTKVKQENVISVKIFQKKINDSLELKNQGNQLFKAHQYKQAIDKYSQGLRLLDPNQFFGATQAQCQKMAEVSASLLFNIGSCFFNINAWKQAEIYFTQTITINPNHIKAIYKRALSRYELKKYEEAMNDIKLAFNKDKSNVQIHKSYEKILQKYNQQLKKEKENLKEISSKIFRSESQKQLVVQAKQQQKKPSGQQQGSLWGLTPLVLVAGAALFFGVKKWLGK